MFFEEESKNTHGNMDDYDLNLNQGESADWDKLLGDDIPDDKPQEIDMTEIPDTQEEDISDSLLDMDDESFENYIQDNKQDIAKNRAEMEDEDAASFEGLNETEDNVVNIDALASSNEIEIQESRYS